MYNNETKAHNVMQTTYSHWYRIISPGPTSKMSLSVGLRDQFDYELYKYIKETDVDRKG